MSNKLISLKIKRIISTVFFASLIIAATGCVSDPPRNQSNICSIFKQHPKWFWEAQQSYKKWGVPISVQLSIIKHESSFRANAKPPRTTLLGFIPWSRPTTAYGYAQATNGTWKHYIKSTGHQSADRDEFGDATNFVGWYGYRAYKKLGISRRNAYDLYLAYHEGIGGYAKGTYRKKAWLMRTAERVNRQARTYRTQLIGCYKNIPKPSVWNLWLI